MVNYDTAYSKAAYKYLLKTFYNKTNKKEYDLQIRQHNICHIKIIAMKNVIIAAKRGRKNQELLVEKVDKVAMVEVVRVLITIDVNNKYR